MKIRPIEIFRASGVLFESLALNYGHRRQARIEYRPLLVARLGSMWLIRDDFPSLRLLTQFGEYFRLLPLMRNTEKLKILGGAEPIEFLSSLPLKNACANNVKSPKAASETQPIDMFTSDERAFYGISISGHLGAMD